MMLSRGLVNSQSPAVSRRDVGMLMRTEIQNEAIRLARLFRHSTVTEHHVLTAMVTSYARFDEELGFLRINCRESLRGLIKNGIVSRANSNDLGITPRAAFWIAQINDELSLLAPYDLYASILELAAELNISTDRVTTRSVKPGESQPKASSATSHKKTATSSGQEDQETDELTEAMAELDQLHGLESVKKRVREVSNHAKMNAARKKQGLPEVEMGLNLIFTGNPGTGKTTVARIVAKIYKALGVLPGGHLVEAGEAALVGVYIGETVQKTTDVINKSLGGVLFIDEAYSLVQEKAGGYGKQAVHTLVAEMENRRNEFAVIVAGYTAPMLEFVKSNEGLKSRFTHEIHFPDYSSTELLEVFRVIAETNSVDVSDDVAAAVLRHFKSNPTGGAAGNGRYARKLFVRMYELMSDRALEDGVIEDHELTAFEVADVPAHLDSAGPVPTLEEVQRELNRMVGLREVKDKVNELIVHARANRVLEANNLPTVDFSLNLVFTGSPGTGKTTVARLVSRAYRAIGVLPRGHLVESSRTDFEAEYLGQSGAKTLALIERAMGGVLFIDEAYSLNDPHKQGYGHEIIDTIVNEMENRRGQMAFIAAGYKDEMNHFLESNPGLRSRFGTVMDFADFNDEEMLTIFEGLATEKLIRLSDTTVDALRKHFKANNTGGAAGNGRYARILFEKCYANLLLRTRKDPTVENLTRLKPEDVPDRLSEADKMKIVGFAPNPQ